MKKLADRILVVVEVDALPIQMRSQLFTADRSQFVQSPEAVRLEQEIASFIADWSELVAANNDLIREQIEGGDTKRSTVGVAQRIVRAYKAKGGFSLGARGGGSGGGGKVRSRNRRQASTTTRPTSRGPSKFRPNWAPSSLCTMN